MYLDRDAFEQLYPRSGYSKTRDQSMMEGGVTEGPGGKNTASFLFRESPQIKVKTQR